MLESSIKLNFIDKYQTTQLSSFIGKVKNGKRDKLIDLLSKYGIQCVVQYYPLNRYDLYSKLNLSISIAPMLMNSLII